MHAFSSVLLFVFESVKEDVFWRNYFYRVSLIKQSAQLTALAAQQQAAGKEEKNHGRQNELPLTGIFKKASLCRANVTNVPLKNTQILMILSLYTCQKCHRYLRENPFPSREDIHSSPVALSLTLPTCLPSVFIYFAFSHSSGFLFLPFYFSLHHQSSSHLSPCPSHAFCSPLTQFPTFLWFCLPFSLLMSPVL